MPGAVVNKVADGGHSATSIELKAYHDRLRNKELKDDGGQQAASIGLQTYHQRLRNKELNDTHEKEIRTTR
jgi:hypothetical protein